MHYTITAMAPNPGVLRRMYDALQNICAAPDIITIEPHAAGGYLPMLSVSTTDLELSECYEQAFAEAGASLIASNEESSAHDAITDAMVEEVEAAPTPVGNAQNATAKRKLKKDSKEVQVTQAGDDWHIEHVTEGKVLIFSDRDSAIAYTASLFFDGPSLARAETQRGEQALQPDQEIDRDKVERFH